MPDTVKIDANFGESKGSVSLRRDAEERFQEALHGMADQRRKWRDAERTYWNDDQFPSRFKNITQVKIARPMGIIETEMSLFSDFLPTFDYLPVKNGTQEHVDRLQRRKRQLERSGRFRARSLEVVRDAQVYGIGLMEVKHGLNEERLLQAVEFNPVDPFTFLPSADAISMDLRQTEYICFGAPMNITAIKRRWGQAAKDVVGDSDLDDFRAFHNQDEQRSLFSTNRRRRSHQRDSRHALVKECYWMDEEGDIQYIVWAGNRTLDSGVLPLPRLNYFDLTNYRTAHTLFGYPETQMLAGLYRAVNRIYSQLSNYIQKLGAPQKKAMSRWVRAQTENTQDSITPGSTIEVENMGDVDWMQPPAMPAQVFSVLQWAKTYEEDITGVFESIQGRLPASDTSGRAIGLLQEASQAKIRLKNSTWVTTFMEEVGEYMFWLQRNFDHQIVDVRLENENGFEFEQANMAEAADVVDEVEVRVTTGTRPPAGRAAAEARALDLFDKGLYGPEDVFEAMDEDERVEKLERFRQRQGLEGLRQRQEQLQQAHQQFRRWADQAIENPDTFLADRDADHIVELLGQFPELVQTPDFQALPLELKRQFAAEAFGGSLAGLSEAAGG